MEIDNRILTRGEVAVLFRVDPKTVTRWATAGWISSIRTPGGHRRFRESEVHGLLICRGYLMDGHNYTSTACQHDRHGECRQTCKFCDSECRCSCHEAVEE